MHVNRNNPLFYYSITFPREYFENQNISDEDFEVGVKQVDKIFDMGENYEIKTDNHNYGQLIKLLSLARRYDRLKKPINYIIGKFHNDVKQGWKTHYNFIFSGISMFGGLNSEIIGMDTTNLFAIIKYKKRYIEDYRKKHNFFTGEDLPEIKYNEEKFSDTLLTPEQRDECYNITIVIREIICVSVIINNQINSTNIFTDNSISPISIQNLYNLLEKFNELFLFLFEFEPLDVTDILSPYRFVRNAIAHSHFVFDKNRGIKLVNWNYNGNKQKKYGGLLNFDLVEITKEMCYLCAIISQIIALYQLMVQSKQKRA